MMNLYDLSARTAAMPDAARAYRCRCGQALAFASRTCPACRAVLGYDPRRQRLLVLQPAARGWRELGAADGAALYRRCAQRDTVVACNWLLRADDADGADDAGAALCRCCRLSEPARGSSRAASWRAGCAEHAKRHWLSSLIALQLPVRSRLDDDRQHGLMFERRAMRRRNRPARADAAAGVMALYQRACPSVWAPTPAAAGRSSVQATSKALLEHLRQDSGHYYWQRLVQPGRWLEPWRAVFGDERGDYAAACARYRVIGEPADWREHFVSAEASRHPWDDWAHSWSCYLKLVDALETARSFGLEPRRWPGVQPHLDSEAIGTAESGSVGDVADTVFLERINAWIALAAQMNELSRRVGRAESAAASLSRPLLRKLYLVHRVIADAAP